MTTANRYHKRFIVGPLPLIDSIIRRTGIKHILKQYFHRHGNDKIDPVDTLLLLVYNLILSKSPLYELEEWCASLDLQRISIKSPEGVFSDDRFGKVLDKLYLTDRSSLMTDLVVSYVRAFEIDISRLHNDSTTVKAYGKYPGKTSDGFELKRGHSKDYRPDLKQLVFNLTISSDFAVPVHHHCYSGNRTDDTTHIETWQTLHRIFGTTDFLYVADSKVCTANQLDTIVSLGGAVITIIPETWKIVEKFKTELRSKVKAKKIIWRRNKPGTQDQEEYFSVFTGDHSTAQGYKVHWLYSSEKKERDRESRDAGLVKAEEDLAKFNSSLQRNKKLAHSQIKNRVEEILKERHVTPLLRYEIREVIYKQQKQKGRGRPSIKTKYVTVTEKFFSIHWYRDKKNIKLETRIDGVFPLLCTSDKLKSVEVVKAYKYQPRLEKRFTQFKNIQNAAPLLFKKAERVEANMFAFFIALAIQSLLERELRKCMESNNCREMYIYPEERKCKAPTAAIVFDRFLHVSRYETIENGKVIESYKDQLTSSQKEILSVLGINENEYWIPK